MLIWLSPRVEPSGGGGLLWIWPWRLIQPSSRGTIGRCEKMIFVSLLNTTWIGVLLMSTPQDSYLVLLSRSWLPRIKIIFPFNVSVRRSKLLLFPNEKSPKCRTVSSGEIRSFQFLIINSCQFSGRLQYIPTLTWKKCVSEMIQVSGVITSVLSWAILWCKVVTRIIYFTPI